MVYMMEQHTGNMENLVEERNEQLSIEKKRIENLLARMLPKAVTKQLKQGKEVEAETFEQVSIYFSDIVGFTSLCAESTAMEVSFNIFFIVHGKRKIISHKLNNKRIAITFGENFHENYQILFAL